MNYFVQFLIVFDLICFGVYFGGDIVCTALARCAKTGPERPYEFEVEDEPAEPPLSIDAIRHLFRGEVHDFVCNKLLPSGQETLSALTEPEQTAARFLFCALIGYLKEEAPMDEQSFPMVMEMLNYAEGAKEDGDKDVIDILMEETAARTASARNISAITAVTSSCRWIRRGCCWPAVSSSTTCWESCTAMITTSAMTAFWTMATAFPEKLKKSNEEMEVEEDAPCDR